MFDQHYLAGCCLTAALFLGTWPARAQAPLAVEGIADRSHGSYTGHASFRVPSTNGYSYQVLLDGASRLPTDVWIDVASVDYHELRVWRTNLQSGAVTNTLARFIVRDPVRNAGQSTEDGLPAFTPWPTIPSASNEFTGARLKLIAPQTFPTGYEIPVVAWVENDQGHARRVNGLLQADGHPSLQIKRGVGSGFLAATNRAGTLDYAAHVQGLTTNKLITIESGAAWSNVSGTLPAGATTWSDGARMVVTNTLTIPATATLTVGAGAVVRINPGVDIYLDGALAVNGTVEQPVVFMPNARSQPWGGFWLRSASSRLTGTGVIFTGSGANQNWFGSGGRPGSHRHEQALFYCTNSAVITLTDSAAIWLAGQLSHSVGINGAARYFYNYTRFLFQGGTTGGEHTDSIWTVNDSAFIDTYVRSSPLNVFNDGDEDALYLVNAPAPYANGFTNTLIGWSRDDGIDSGGSGPGVFRFKSCWFESTYHEGNSLSGVSSTSAHADKDSAHLDGVFLGCGQGYENGYGAVTGRIDHCLMLSGKIGFRFGDNYTFQYYGRHSATNSILLNNHRDVWGMTFQPDTSGLYQGWVYRAAAMDVRSNFLSVPNVYHPSNTLWNPAADGWRLAPFMTTPPGADVGIGFAVWTNRFALSNLFDGVPVGLSIFTTNSVNVDYTFLDGGGATLGGGTLALAPGQTVNRIYPAGFELSAQTVVRVVLSNPVRGELTGETTVTFAGSVPSRTVTCWLGTNQLDLARLGEGVPLILSGPSAEAVSVRYFFEGDNGTLASGTVTFAPGETVQWVSLPDTIDLDLVRFNLSQPAWAQLGSLATAYFVTNPLPPLSPPRLYPGQFGGQLVLAWTDPAYLLEQADEVTGPWRLAANASPLGVNPSAPQKFFRLRKR